MNTDLDLSRVDYLQVGLLNPKTANLLPSVGGKAQQKVTGMKELY
jgi:hypothetical protein